MREQTTLKDLLKPPVAVNGCRTSDGYINFDVNYPAWFCGEELENAAREFAEQALNEKWERDFGEPMRWLLQHDKLADQPIFECPKCQRIVVVRFNDYCAFCGQRLLPPEEEVK